MADVATLTVKVDTRDVNKAKIALQKFSKGTAKVEKASQKMEKQLASAAKGFKTFAIGIGVAATAAAAAFLAVGSKSLQMASDLEETQGKFDVVFRGMTGSAEKWSKNLQDNYAQSEEESKRFLSSIQDLLVPTGLMREEAGALSNEFVKLAADLGSFNNLPTEKVIQDIQSALQGSSETMAKYGINVKAAKVEQEILNSGLARSKEAITDAHKAQAIFNIAMREGADAVGDMERTSGSFANQQKKLRANIDDIITSIGTGLLPAATAIVTQVNNWIERNETLVDSLGVRLVGAFGTVINVMEFFHIAWLSLQTAVPIVVDTFVRGMNIIFNILRKFVVLLDIVFNALVALGQLEINPLDKVQEQIDGMIDATTAVKEQTFQDIIDVKAKYDEWGGKIEEVKKSLKPLAEEHKKMAAIIVESIEEVGKKYTEFTKKELKDFAKEGEKLGKDMWLSFAEGSEEATRRGIQAIGEMEESTVDLTATMGDLWTDFGTSVKSELVDMVANFEFSFDGILDLFKQMIAQMLVEWAAAQFGFGDFSFGGLISGLGESLGGLVSGIGETLGINELVSNLGSLVGLGGGAVSAAAGTGVITAGTELALAEGTFGIGAGGVGVGAGGTGIGAGGAGNFAAMAGPAALAAVSAFVFAEVYKGFTTEIETIPESLERLGIGTGEFFSMFEEELTPISEAMHEAIPSFGVYTQAMVDIETQTLVTLGGLQRHSEEMRISAHAINEQTGALESMGSELRVVEGVLQHAQDAGSELTVEYIEQIAALYGLTGATDALIEKYIGVTAATAKAVDSIDSVSRSLRSIGSGGGGEGDQGQFHAGTDFVPRTGSYLLEKGEKVIPAKGYSGDNPINLTMPINIGGKKIKDIILSIADGHITAKDEREVLGRVAFA